MPELLGANPQHRATVACLGNVIVDLKMSVTMPCYMGDKAKAIEAMQEKLPPVYQFLENNTYLSGNKPVWVDFYFFELV